MPGLVGMGREGRQGWVRGCGGKRVVGLGCRGGWGGRVRLARWLLAGLGRGRGDDGTGPEGMGEGLGGLDWPGRGRLTAEWAGAEEWQE